LRPTGSTATVLGMRAFLAVLTFAIFTTLAFAVDEPAKDAPVKIEEAEKLIADGVQLLDVRTQEEWDAGHLKGAKQVDFTADGFIEKAKAAMDPKKPVLVYCRSGGRSAKATKALRDAGFTAVHDMAGGITAWQKAGKPVEK
jgi:rhodanese-related sulfurtransferase